MRAALLALALTLVGCQTVEPDVIFFPALREDTQKPVVERSHLRFARGQIPAFVVSGRAALGKEAFLEFVRDGKFLTVSPVATVADNGYWWSVKLPSGTYTAVLYVQGQPKAESQFVVE